MTLQEQATKEGVSRQAIWARTAKGKAYRKAYYLRIIKPKRQNNPK